MRAGFFDAGTTAHQDSFPFMILIGSQTPHRSSPAIGRLFRPLWVAFALALFVTAFSDAHAAPSFEQQYEKAKQVWSFLKS